MIFLIKNKLTTKMYTISYTKKGITYDKVNNKSYITIIASSNHKHIHKIDIEYKYKDEYVVVCLEKHIISSFYYSIVNYENCNNAHMWEKIKHVNRDHFVYGFISYVAMFFLFEQTNFMSLLPISIDIPCTIARGDCCDAQVMKYMNKALHGIMGEIHNQFVYHYIYFVQQFIHKYGKMFHIGPPIDNYYHHKLDTELSKFTQKTCEPTSNTCTNTYETSSTCEMSNTICTNTYETTDNTCTDSYETKTCTNTYETCNTYETVYENTCTSEESSDNTVSYYTCSTCVDSTCTCSNTYEDSTYEEQSCANNIIQLTFATCPQTNLTEADKAYIRQMIRDEIHKYIK